MERERKTSDLDISPTFLPRLCQRAKQGVAEWNVDRGLQTTLGLGLFPPTGVNGLCLDVALRLAATFTSCSTQEKVGEMDGEQNLHM